MQSRSEGLSNDNPPDQSDIDQPKDVTGPTPDQTPDPALLDEVYDQLRRLARVLMSGERPGQTLDPTALVHEAYVRMSGENPNRWSDRRHFYLVAARAMRRILVERARRRGRERHGGERERIRFAEADFAIDGESLDILDLDDALRRLGEVDSRAMQVVMLRFFVGLSVEETAETLGVGLTTAKREWTFARAWLYRVLGEGRE